MVIHIESCLNFRCLFLTLDGLTDHSVLHVIYAAYVFPLPRVAVQSRTRFCWQEVWWIAALPVSERNRFLIKPPHVLTWEDEQQQPALRRGAALNLENVQHV